MKRNIKITLFMVLALMFLLPCIAGAAFRIPGIGSIGGKSSGTAKGRPPGLLTSTAYQVKGQVLLKDLQTNTVTPGAGVDVIIAYRGHFNTATNGSGDTWTGTKILVKTKTSSNGSFDVKVAAEECIVCLWKQGFRPYTGPTRYLKKYGDGDNGTVTLINADTQLHQKLIIK